MRLYRGLPPRFPRMPPIDARRSLAAFALVFALAGCATKPAPAPPDAAPELAHHRDQRFQNRHLEFGTKPFEDFLRWRFLAWRNGLPPPPTEPIPVVEPDRAFIAANARAGAAMQPAVTWIGHATVLVQLGGLNVLTDPIFSERASPLDFVGPRRHQPPALRLDELPRIDAVVREPQPLRPLRPREPRRARAPAGRVAALPRAARREGAARRRRDRARRSSSTGGSRSRSTAPRVRSSSC